MWIGPPKALEAPKPMSSISTITTFGAPSGAFTSKRGGALAFRASSSLMTAGAGSWIGRTVRSSPSAVLGTSASFFAQDTANSSVATARPIRKILNFFIDEYLGR